MTEGLPVNSSPLPQVRRHRDIHLTASYREELGSHYSDNIEMRDLELLRQSEAKLNDTEVEKFNDLFQGPVSGYRIADWIRIAIARAIPHLCDEHIEESKQVYTIPFMARDGKFGRLVMNYADVVECEDQDLGYVYLYKSKDSAGLQGLSMTGLYLHKQARLDPAIGMSIDVTSVRLVQTDINRDIPEQPVGIQSGEDLLTIRPFTAAGDKFVAILRQLDEALEFISQD